MPFNRSFRSPEEKANISAGVRFSNGGYQYEDWPTHREGACLIWDGARGDRYGVVYFDGKSHAVHRVAYERAYGPIPTGKLVCHDCDTPLCVEPLHLFLGTAGQNVWDAILKDRRPGTNSGSFQPGHTRTPKGLRKNYHGTTNGYTHYNCRCPKCVLVWREYQLDYYHKHKKLVG